MASFAFKGVQAHVTTTIGGIVTTMSAWAACTGLFYCCIRDKVGTVFIVATTLACKGFLVQPNWIFNLVQLQKLDIEVAKALLLQCANASRHIRELELNEKHLEDAAVRKAQEEALRLLAPYTESILAVSRGCCIHGTV